MVKELVKNLHNRGKTGITFERPNLKTSNGIGEGKLLYRNRFKINENTPEIVAINSNAWHDLGMFRPTRPYFPNSRCIG